MKRIIALFLLLAMAVSLCACGGTAAPGGDGQEAQQAAQEAPAEPTEAPEPEVNWEEIYNEAAPLYYMESNDAAAFEAIKDAEEADYAPALRLLGTCYLNGNGTEKDAEKGLTLLEKAVELGDVFALYLVGNAYQNGLGTETDFEKAKEFYAQFMQSAESAAENDTPEQGNILYSMGYSYRYGRGTAFDKDKALEAFQKAVETEKLSPTVLYSIAAAIENAKKTTSASLYRKALPGMEELAESGNASAQRYMGQYCYYGDAGTPVNYEKAFEWFSKAAEQGDTGAKFHLAQMYRIPLGVEKDDQKALDLLLEAAELGNTSAMNQLGKLYEDDTGYYGSVVDLDYAKAMEWYLKAAERGSSEAIFNIGGLYYEGKGVAKSYQTSLECCTKAAEYGNSAAMNQIGVSYYYGYGVEKDYVEAASWFLKAAELGNETAENNLKVKEIADALPEARKRLG